MAGTHSRSTRVTAERLGAPVPGSRRTERPAGVGWWQPPVSGRRPRRLPRTMLVRWLHRLLPRRTPSWPWPSRTVRSRLLTATRRTHRHRRVPGTLPGPAAM